MKTYRTRYSIGIRFSIVSLTAAALLMLSAAAQAQHVPTKNGAAQSDAAMLLAEEVPSEEGGWAALLKEGGATSTLSGADLSSMTKKEWRALRREHLAALRSADEHTWQAALQNIIHLSRFYGEEVDFRRAATPMLEIYIFDPKEHHRILALVGLHAVGHPSAMAHLAQRVKLERSPRVRRLTLAALADHYGLRDYHGSRVGGSQEGFVTDSPASAQRQ